MSKDKPFGGVVGVYEGAEPSGHGIGMPCPVTSLERCSACEGSGGALVTALGRPRNSKHDEWIDCEACAGTGYTGKREPLDELPGEPDRHSVLEEFAEVLGGEQLPSTNLLVPSRWTDRGEDFLYELRLVAVLPRRP